MKSAEERRKIEKEKRLKRFYKKIGLSGNERRAVIDKAVLNYISHKPDWSLVILSDEQRNDPKFMLKLCEQNFSNGSFFGISKSLSENEDFVLEYLKLREKHEIECAKKYNPTSKNGSEQAEQKLSSFIYYTIIRETTDSWQEPKFLTRLAREFANVNILQVTNMLLADEIFSPKSREPKFNEILRELPQDLLIEQARKFGKQTVRYLPQNHPQFMECVRAGIKADGFGTLALLSNESQSIWENRNLIAEATNSYQSKVEALVELSKYFIDTIAPVRTVWDYEDSYRIVRDDFHPLRLALVNDDELFNAIELPENLENELRDRIRKEEEEFYKQIDIHQFDKNKTGAKATENPNKTETVNQTTTKNLNKNDGEGK